MYRRDTGRGNSREGGREYTVGTPVGATVGRGGGQFLQRVRDEPAWEPKLRREAAGGGGGGVRIRW